MPSTVYKGDLAEVTFGRESALYLPDGTFGNLNFQVTNGSTDDTSVLTFTGVSGTTTHWLFDSSHRLKVPENMLVGATLRINGGTNYGDDDSISTKREFSIVGNTSNTITVAPRLKTAASTNSGASDSITIGPFLVPSADVANTIFNATPKTTQESTLTDQFVGIAGTVNLPETRMEIKRYHVVGIGRDTVVQAPSRITNEGGSIDLILHSPRWLYYCLGKMASEPTSYHKGANMKSTLSSATAAGQSHILVELGSKTTFDTGAVAAGHYVYIQEPAGSSGDNLVPLHQHREDDLSVADSSNLYFGKKSAGALLNVTIDTPHADATVRSEIRRIVAVDTDSDILWLDGPLDFPHDSGRAVHFLEYRNSVYDTGINTAAAPSAGHTGTIAVSTDPTAIISDGTELYKSDGTRIGKVTATATGPNTITIGGGTLVDLANPTDLYAMMSPHITSDRYVADAVDHVIFSRDTTPSFCLETSIRTREAGSYSSEDATFVPGSATDSKVLTRVFKGCKVTNWSMSADTDAALKLSVNFNAAMCYTDTGRLHATAASRGDRLKAHRMFENTANTELGRKESGIIKYGEKPYFFYNGTITIGGTTVAQVTNFTLSGTTGVEYYHVINGAPLAQSTGMSGAAGHTFSTEQIPFAGTRNPRCAVEGKQSFDMNMEILIDDPIFWHYMRTAEEFNTTTGANADGVVLKFVKQGSGKTGLTGTPYYEAMTIVVDDFFISEAPLPIPEDKGVLRASLKIMPKHVRILARDAMFTY